MRYLRNSNLRVGIYPSIHRTKIGPARFWRLFISVSNDVDYQNNYTTISEINFRTQHGVAGPMIGNMSAISVYPGYPPENAVDGSFTTGWITAAGFPRNSWWKIEYASERDIVEVAVSSFPNALGAQQMLRDAVVQKSLNGIDWVNVIPINNQRNWSSSGETRVFSI
jgi:F5/8 type C domain